MKNDQTIIEQLDALCRPLIAFLEEYDDSAALVIRAGRIELLKTDIMIPICPPAVVEP